MEFRFSWTYIFLNFIYIRQQAANIITFEIEQWNIRIIMYVHTYGTYLRNAVHYPKREWRPLRDGIHLDSFYYIVFISLNKPRNKLGRIIKGVLKAFF